MHLNIAALISIDINVILMLGYMVRATFFFIILQLRALTMQTQLSADFVCAMGAKALCLPSRICAVGMPNDGHDLTLYYLL